MISRRNRVLLAGMRLVEAISASVGTISYIWGGFALDIHQGQLLREHSDLDYLTVDLARHKPELAALFARKRWPAKVVSNGDLSPRRSGYRMQLGNITIAGDRVRWTFAGEAGFLEFPRSWLHPGPVRFCGVDVHVVEPEFEYVIKCCPQMFNPDWKARANDDEVRSHIRALLDRRHVDPDELYAQISFCRAVPEALPCPTPR